MSVSHHKSISKRPDLVFIDHEKKIRTHSRMGTGSDHLILAPHNADVTTAVSEVSERIFNDFPALRNHLDIITYGYDRDGAAGAARSDGKEILLDVRSFKSLETLKSVLSENVKSHHTAKAENPMFIVAHEFGHCIESMVAMRRLGISNIASEKDVHNLRLEKQKMWSEYYLHMGFSDESFDEIMRVIDSEVGTYAVSTPKEILANSLGIWYYGLGDHPHVDSLISYIKETAR